MVLGFSVALFVVVLPVQLLAAGVTGVVALVVGTAVAIATSPAVHVADGELRAGRAHIPVVDLGRGDTLDRDGLRQALGPGSDATAFVCLRAWIPTAVQLAVTDLQDPTPSWLVSTRHPEAMLAAIRGQREAQAAHSEQII